MTLLAFDQLSFWLGWGLGCGGAALPMIVGVLAR